MTKKENELERDTWSGKLDFIFSCIGMAVGMGNVWRFPHICYKNGGGAFFIPYLLMIILLALPLTFMDFCIGQFCSLDCIKSRNFSPIFKGIGISQTIGLLMCSVTYCQVIAYAGYFVVASFSSELPWSTCDADWNTPGCRLKLPNVDCDGNFTTKYDNGTCYENSTFIGLWDYKTFHNETGIQRTLASEEYFNNRVLQLTDGLHDLGGISWELFLSLLVIWIIIVLTVLKGIHSAGKIVYATAIFPYIVLTILLVRGLTLPHSTDGIIYYLKPQWKRLLDAKVWYDAAVQVIYSYGACCGLSNTLASYNHFRKNILRDTIILGVVNSGTSVFAGFVIFSFLGFLSHSLEEPIENVAQGGSGLAFVLYPALASRLPFPQVWSVLFFFMLMCLGVDSMFAHMEMLMTIPMDHYQRCRRYKPVVAVVVALPVFLAGILLCTHGGMYILYLVDSYSYGWVLMTNAILHTISISYVYGIDRFYEDIRLMIGYYPSVWWKICWKFVTPFVLIAIIIFAIVDYGPPKYGDYVFPEWAKLLGWLIFVSVAIWIPAVAIYYVVKEKGTLMQRIKLASRPTRDWGPAQVEDRKLVDYVPGFVVDPWRSHFDETENGKMLTPLNDKAI